MEQFLQFDPATINPNLVYMALVLGLWVGITAIYIPGTIVVEAVAFILLGATLLVLSAMPTNWLAVVLLILGLTGFLTVPFLNPRWARAAELGLILQGIGGFFLFNGLSVSPILLVITLGLSLAYHRTILLPIMRHQQQKPDDITNLVGAHGRVVKLIDPLGLVRVRGETWTARSSQQLEADTEIEVVAQNGLELIVEKAKHNDSSA